MKTRLALVILPIAAAIVVVTFLRFPAPRPVPSPGLAPSPPPRPALAPREVVISYLQALERKDFRSAYQHLSRESQRTHSFDNFVSLCGKGGVPNYDLGAAQEKSTASDRATVTVPLIEDPAEADFTTIWEEGRWRIVFIGGAPSFPYPE